MALAPGDLDLTLAYEATVRAYGNAIELEGFAEGGVSDARSGSFTGSLRVSPRLLLEGIVRVQDRDGSSDAIAGGGGIVRVNRSTNFSFRVGGGSDNVSLANGDATMEVRHYFGPFELGFNYRYLSFTDVKVNPYRQFWRGTPTRAGDWPRATPIPGRHSRPPARPPAITPHWFAPRSARRAGWTRRSRTRTASKASKISQPIGSPIWAGTPWPPRYACEWPHSRPWRRPGNTSGGRTIRRSTG